MTSTKSQPTITVRAAIVDDSAICGKICYEAFLQINSAHGFPSDLPGREAAAGVIAMMFSHPGFSCVVAEADGCIVGSNCLDERSVIAGVGPITINPGAQNLGVGRALMRAVLDRATQRQSAGVRLVQAAWHSRSLSLYSSLGFDVREPLSCLQGRTAERSIPSCHVRPAELDDLNACNSLARQVHGFDRGAELAEAIERNTALVVERGGRITGYTTALAFFGHSTAETNLDLQALISSAESFGGAGILVPSRNNALLR